MIFLCRTRIFLIEVLLRGKRTILEFNLLCGARIKENYICLSDEHAFRGLMPAGDSIRIMREG